MHRGSYYDSVLAIEMKNKFRVFFQLWCLFNISDYYGTQVYFVSLQCWFLCMTSLVVTSSILKTSVKFWGTSFKSWLCPWTYQILIKMRQAIASFHHPRDNKTTLMTRLNWGIGKYVWMFKYLVNLQHPGIHLKGIYQRDSLLVE